MRNTLRQVFHSPKFVIGFAIFSIMLLTVIIYPLVIRDDPLAMVGQGTFFPLGTYVSAYDVIDANASDATSYTMKLETLWKRVEAKLSAEDEQKIKQWLDDFGEVPLDELVGYGVSRVADLDTPDVNQLHAVITLWQKYYAADKDHSKRSADKKYFKRLDGTLKDLLTEDDLTVTTETTEGAAPFADVTSSDFVNIDDVANKRTLVLGTDNFGRDVLTELVSAIGTSLKIGLVAGAIATALGLSLGLLSGFAGGIVDNIIMFFTNLLTVIPSFILLVLISYSVGQESRGVMIVAVIIGLTAWPWTCRSVRSQVISLRNRDHVNLSKLSGHSTFRIILTDILPYVASYVVMALILQISSGILAEAQLSMLGLGPATTENATLGLMMNWAMLYSAHMFGKWWAYFPVVFSIALVSFSLNFMNTGLDQAFNPTLRS